MNLLGFQGHGVKGQGHIYECVNAVTVEAYILNLQCGIEAHLS